MGYLQKEGLQPNPETLKTILDRNSAYKLHTYYVRNLFLTFSCSITFLIKFSYFFDFIFSITIGAFGYLL